MTWKWHLKKWPAFSLIELALVLIVVGILMGAIFKGQDVVEGAKMRSVLTDIERIRTASMLYHDTFGQWPGNDSLAKTRFGDDVINGHGTGVISKEEGHQFWIHLAKAEYMPQATAPSSKMGGIFTVEGEASQGKNFLILSASQKGGLFTPKQAANLKAKAGESDPTLGMLLFSEGTNVSPGSCLKNGLLFLEAKTPTCILKVPLH